MGPCCGHRPHPNPARMRRSAQQSMFSRDNLSRLLVASQRALARPGSGRRGHALAFHRQRHADLQPLDPRRLGQRIGGVRPPMCNAPLRRLMPAVTFTNTNAPTIMFAKKGAAIIKRTTRQKLAGGSGNRTLRGSFRSRSATGETHCYRPRWDEPLSNARRGLTGRRIPTAVGGSLGVACADSDQSAQF